MTTHRLKTVNPYFDEVWKGTKKAELRLNDRDFRVGDEVYLQEYDLTFQEYLSREVRCVITHVLENYNGLHDQYVMFSFSVIQHIELYRTTYPKK